MRTLWISTLMALSLLGCSSKAKLLPQDGPTILEIYNRHMAGADQAALETARNASTESNAVDGATDVDHTDYTRTAANELHTQFQRLDNPDLLMYVFAHLATHDQVPVPGYTTVFPLYERVLYALPGEQP